MIKVVAIFLVALVATNAYDFSDTFFNQFLFNEYEALNAQTIRRHRRDVQEVSAEELAKEIVSSLPEHATDAAEKAPLNTLIVLETLNPEKVDDLLNHKQKIEDHKVKVDDHTTVTPLKDHHEEPYVIKAPVAEKEEVMSTTTTTTTQKPLPSTTTYVHSTTTSPMTTRKAYTTKKPAFDEDDRSFQCKSGPIEMKNDLTCCDANRHDPAYFAMLRGTKKQCAMKLRSNNPIVENFDPFNCEHLEKIKQLIICESECVAKTLNMIDEHSDISRDGVVERFKTHLYGIEDSKIKSFEGYVDKCLSKLKHLNLQTEEGKCSSIPMEFQHCMFGEMVVGCPKEHQVDSQRCQKIRERYGRGESLALGKTSILDFLHPSKRNNVYSKA